MSSGKISYSLDEKEWYLRFSSAVNRVPFCINRFFRFNELELTMQLIYRPYSNEVLDWKTCDSCYRLESTYSLIWALRISMFIHSISSSPSGTPIVSLTSCFSIIFTEPFQHLSISFPEHAVHGAIGWIQTCDIIITISFSTLCNLSADLLVFLFFFSFQLWHLFNEQFNN